jgi:hypothetical protein
MICAYAWYRDKSVRLAEEGQEEITAKRRAAMTWAQRLKRIFGIDITTCPACGGVLRIIACIEDPVGFQISPSVIETGASHGEFGG